MSRLLKKLPENQQAKLKETDIPDWVDPMLATLTEDYFDDENWIYERKLDGVRLLCFKSGADVTLKSRNKNNLTHTYPELADALGKTSPELFIADGEVVAFDDKRTSFSKLQNRIHISDPEKARTSDVEVFLYLFDLIYFAGFDLTQLELRSRKNILKKALNFKEPVRFTSHRNKEGISYLNEACRKKWEGLIAKDARAAYVQSRSKKWLKFKCTARQELVIGDYTDPQGERVGFGALLLGYYKNGELRYAGRVGTGFNDDLLKELHGKLRHIESKSNPFEENDIKEKHVHWVTPKLVAQIGFTEWTNDLKLRHPRFLGPRTDKKPEDVHIEKP